MKICVAQIQPARGDVEKNISGHIELIQLAIAQNAVAIFFPELSLSSYEPSMAKSLATEQDDPRLDVFQDLSDAHQLTIGIGMPTPANDQVHISMIIFQPHRKRQTYSKQFLYADEDLFFVPGSEQFCLTIGNKTIAPAICYESTLLEHTEQAVQKGANIYIASVVDSASGVSKAWNHYPGIAKQFAMPVLMSNTIGPCESIESKGSSAVWDSNGNLLGSLDEISEGILVYDLEQNKVEKYLA